MTLRFKAHFESESYSYTTTGNCVARKFGYLTLFLNDVRLKGRVDSRQLVLKFEYGQLWKRRFLKFLARPFLTEAIARAIATVTRVIASVLTVEALDRT